MTKLSTKKSAVYAKKNRDELRRLKGLVATGGNVTEALNTLIAQTKTRIAARKQELIMAAITSAGADADPVAATMKGAEACKTDTSLKAMATLLAALDAALKVVPAEPTTAVA